MVILHSGYSALHYTALYISVSSAVSVSTNNLQFPPQNVQCDLFTRRAGYEDIKPIMFYQTENKLNFRFLEEEEKMKKK